MNRLIWLSVLLPLGLVPAFAQETATGSSTITLGVGGAWGIRNYGPVSGGPAFNATYEYRVRRYLALEAGVHNTLVTAYQYSSGQIVTCTPFDPATSVSLCSASGYLSSTSRAGARDTSVPFGFRGILPARQGKVELFLGAGGAFLWKTNQYDKEWLAQSRLGGRFAIDKHRHVWLGVTGEYSREIGDRKNWSTWTADLGYRFGK